MELLLPDGGEEIEWAAKRFVETVGPDDLVKLDQALQALVLDPRGGLFGACQKAGDFMAELADPLIDQTSAFLGTLLPRDRRGRVPEPAPGRLGPPAPAGVRPGLPTVPGRPTVNTATCSSRTRPAGSTWPPRPRSTRTTWPSSGRRGRTR